MIARACLERQLHRLRGITGGVPAGSGKIAVQTRFNSSLSAPETLPETANEEDNPTLGRRTRQEYWFSPELRSPSIEVRNPHAEY